MQVFDGLCKSENFKRTIRFVQFSIICKHVVRNRVVMYYIRKRLSIQNKKELDRAQGTPKVRSEGADYALFAVTTCGMRDHR